MKTHIEARNELSPAKARPFKSLGPDELSVRYEDNLVTFTPREWEIISLIYSGVTTNKHLQERLKGSVSLQTLKNHLNAIYSKLGITRETHGEQKIALITIAIHCQMVPPQLIGQSLIFGEE